MPTPKSRLVRVMPEEQIVAITGTLPYATSIGRSWAGVEVHRYRLTGPSQTTEFRLPQLAIFCLTSIVPFVRAKNSGMTSRPKTSARMLSRLRLLR